MSAFGGLCAWSGQPISNDRVGELADHLRVGGPDGGGTIQPKPWLSMQAHVLHFDRLSAQEHQPYVFAGGSVLTWDGRLDNRDDLLLRLHRKLRSDISDAALVSAAYEQWGVDAFPHLIGDWSLAVWDASEQRLVLARDYMGNRPLYYRTTGERLTWATRLEALAACEQCFGMPNDLYIMGFLAELGSSDDSTEFHAISKLLAGHVLTANKDGVTIRRYWRFTPTTLRHGDSNQHAEQLRLLMTEGVRVRLRSMSPVWTHLSGGWDSSTVTCVAHRLIERRLVEAPALHTLSVVSDDNESAEERAYMAAVEQWCGLTTSEHAFRVSASFDELLGHATIVPTRSTFDMERSMQAAGHRVVLTGEFGDLTRGTEGGALLSLWEPFELGHPLAGLRGLVTYAHSQNEPLVQLLIKALNIRYMVTRSSARRSMRAERRARALQHGLNRDLVERTADCRQIGIPPLDDFPRTHRPLVDTLYGFANRDTLSTPEHYSPSIWKTHPFAHRPFIEFLISVPSLSLYDPRFPRAGMRRAFTDILPTAIVQRKTKVGTVVPTYARGLRRHIDESLDAPPLIEPARAWRLVQRGILDPRALDERISRQRADRKQSGFLQRCISIEAWLRSLERRSSSTMSYVPVTRHTKVPHEPLSLA